MRWIRHAPVVAETLIICVAVFACCLLQAGSNRERFEDVQRAWGSIEQLEQVAVHDGIRRSKDPELYGPFDVWDGEWWRIPITVFHHSDLMHLVLCLGATWYLGSRLERIWGSFRTGMFLVPAACLPVMAELCFGRPFHGLSGVICTMLGTIVVLRRHNDRLAAAFPAESGDIGMALILIGWMATILFGVQLPNVAHLTGFLYGASLAWLVRTPVRRVKLLSLSLLLVHLWLIPGLFLVTHPFWIGRYHWFQAGSSRIPRRAEKSLERATKWDPSLSGAWIYWSQSAENRGDFLLAWKRMINGMALNPSSSPLMDGSRRLWRHFDASQRKDAEIVLAEVFGQLSQVWLRQIRTDFPVREIESIEKNINSSDAVNLREIELDQKLELPSLDLLPSRADPRRPPAPIAPNDAAEGQTL